MSASRATASIIPDGISPWIFIRCFLLPKRQRSRPSSEKKAAAVTPARTIPITDAKFAKVNVVIRKNQDGLSVTQEPLPEIPGELKKLLEEQK